MFMYKVSCMKKALYMVLISMVFSTASFGVETITIRSDEWMPFNGQPGDTQYPGFTIEIMKMIFEPKGKHIDYQLMPWARSIRCVRNGTYDAVIGTTSEEAENLIIPKEPMYILPEDTFYVLKDLDWKYQGIESLKEIKLGSIAEYKYSNDLNAYIKLFEGTDKIRVEYGERAHLNLIRALVYGHVNVIIDAPPVFFWEVRRWNIPFDDFQTAGICDNRRSPVYVAFSPARKTSKTYADIFDLEIRKLKDSGRYKELLRKYMLDQ